MSVHSHLVSVLRFFVVISILTVPSNVIADVVNIDFGAQFTSGGNLGPNPRVQVGLAAVLDDPAGADAIWNESDGAVINNALNSAGTATTVSIDVGNPRNFSNLRDQESSAGISSLQGDYILINAGTGQGIVEVGVFGGLMAGESYDLYFYGQGDNFGDGDSGGQNVGVRIGTDVRHTSWDGVAGTQFDPSIGAGGGGGDGFLVEDIEYVLFTGIEADSAGEISFEFFNPGGGELSTNSLFFDSDTNSPDLDGNTSRFAAINGIQIVGNFAAVPEPSSVVAIGLLALGCCTGRRRN